MLTECLEENLVQEWTAQEHVAMKERGDHLKIYEVMSEKCGPFFKTYVAAQINYVFQYQHWWTFV
jgi:hypothetical protein